MFNGLLDQIPTSLSFFPENSHTWIEILSLLPDQLNSLTCPRVPDFQKSNKIYFPTTWSETDVAKALNLFRGNFLKMPLSDLKRKVKERLTDSEMTLISQNVN